MLLWVVDSLAYQDSLQTRDLYIWGSGILTVLGDFLTAALRVRKGMAIILSEPSPVRRGSGRE